MGMNKRKKKKKNNESLPSKDTDEKRVMHSKSDNIEIMVNYKSD